MRPIFLILVIIVLGFGANAQDLQSYIAQAEANNPQLQAYSLRHEIAQEKISETGALPNTTISAGYFVSEPETRTGAQRARISVAQMLPWFGTFTARSSYASSLAEAEFVEVAIARRKLSLSVAQAYYTLYAIRAKQDILDQNIELLTTYEQLALSSVEVGKASAVDVLRLQIRINELKEQKQLLEEQFGAERAGFNALLNRETGTGVEVVPQMGIPAKDPVADEANLALNPELLKYDKLYASVEQSEALNQKEGAPGIGVGLDYVPVSERPDMSFSDNGKDIFMPMVTLSIPIFNNRFTSVSRQNELKQREIEFQKTDRLNALRAVLRQAQSNRNQARIRFDTQEKNLRQAKDAEEILIRNYETGTIDFNDVLDIQQLQLKFQMEQVEAIRSYYAQSSIINYLIS